jgi:glucose-6-phosphate 1-epimerase
VIRHAVLDYDAVMATAHPLIRASLPQGVHLVDELGALPYLDVTTEAATARVYFHGAHVAAWHPSHATRPVLWMSARSCFQRDKPIRGGVPVCFPWFGPHPTDQRAPAHGFGRLEDWSLADAHLDGDGVMALTFTLSHAEIAPALWPHPFRITHRIRIGAALTMTLDVENLGSRTFVFEEALHSYFAVRDLAHVTVGGLHRAEYLDKVAGAARKLQEDELISFSGETDRVYLDTPSTCVIHDPGVGRRISVAKSNSASTIVWNPWIDKARAMPDFGDDEWPQMVCVETGNVRPSPVQLPPGDRHTMTAEITVDSK